MIAGIDTHKDTLAVAVVDDTGQLVAGGDIPNTERGFLQLVNMFDSHHVLRVGIEGSGNFWSIALIIGQKHYEVKVILIVG